MTHELTFPKVPRQRARRVKIEWDPGMLQQIRERFPVEFTRALAASLGIGHRTAIRKARELGIEKEPGFLATRKAEIQGMAAEACRKAYNPGRWKKGRQAGKATQFRKGNVSPLKAYPDIVEKVRQKRNATIARDRRRIRLGLPQLTRMKLKIDI